MIHDERRSIRYPLGMRCAYRLHDAVMVPAAGTIRDVSRQGCCLETTDELGKPDDVIEIHFDAPGDGYAGVIVGTVVQRTKTPLGWTLGVAFQDVNPEVKWDLLDAAYHRWLAGMTPPSSVGVTGG